MVGTSRHKGGGVFNKLQKRNGTVASRGADEFTVRESGGTVRSIAGLRSGNRRLDIDLNYILQVWASL